MAGEPGAVVIVLGDLAGVHVTEPVVVPWSDASVLAPPALINTVAAAVQTQAGLKADGISLLAQFAHQAVPLSTTLQAPFGRYGEPAVLLSVAGNRAIPAAEPVSQQRIAGLGQAVLQTVDALDSGPSVPPPSSYLLLAGKLVPGWAILVLALALLAPVLITVIDAAARLRRRRRSVGRWLLWTLSAALPFLIAVVIVKLAAVSGVLDTTPPSAVGAGAVPLGAVGIALLVVIVIALVAGFAVVRPEIVRRAQTLEGRDAEGSELDGAAVGMLLLMSLTTLVVALVNPFAALLVAPALHLWLWFADASVRARRSVLIPLLLLGLLAPLVILAYYVHSLGLGALGPVWTGVLLVAGGGIGPLAIIYWSVLSGCAVSAAVIVVRALRERRQVDDEPITVRGPATYAGPGSLGGTESALRR